MTDPDRVWMLGRKPFRIDILTSISGVTWDEAWKGHIEPDVDGLRLPMLGLRELIANKRAAGRPKDLADLDSIARVTGVSVAPGPSPKKKLAKTKSKRPRR